MEKPVNLWVSTIVLDQIKIYVAAWVKLVLNYKRA